MLIKHLGLWNITYERTVSSRDHNESKQPGIGGCDQAAGRDLLWLVHGKSETSTTDVNSTDASAARSLVSMSFTSSKQARR